MNLLAYRLRELIKIKHGFAFKSKYFSDSGDKVLLTPGNFRPEGGVKFEWSKQKFYEGHVPEDFILCKDDVLIAMTDLTPACAILGAPLRIPETKYFYLHNQRLGKVELKRPDLLHLNYFYYYCCSNEFRNKVIAFKTGTTVSHTAPERIESIEIFLPSLPIQRRIADILGALDDKIECNRRINQTLEQMAMALYKHWFVDFGPFRDGEFVDSELGPIPKGWEIQSLYESANYINGAAFKSSDFSPDKSGLPIVKISELKNGITFQTEFCNKNLAPKYRINCGDILFSWSGSPETSIDIFFWTGTEAWLNQHTFKVIANNQFERCFVFYLLKYLKPTFIEIARNKQTTGLGHVTIQDMKRIKVVSPNYVIIEKFNGLVEPFFNQVLENKKEENTLTHIRDRLLPKLLSGEIEVK